MNPSISPTETVDDDSERTYLQLGYRVGLLSKTTLDRLASSQDRMSLACTAGGLSEVSSAADGSGHSPHSSPVKYRSRPLSILDLSPQERKILLDLLSISLSEDTPPDPSTSQASSRTSVNHQSSQANQGWRSHIVSNLALASIFLMALAAFLVYQLHELSVKNAKLRSELRGSRHQNLMDREAIDRGDRGFAQVLSSLTLMGSQIADLQQYMLGEGIVLETEDILTPPIHNLWRVRFELTESSSFRGEIPEKRLAMVLQARGKLLSAAMRPEEAIHEFRSSVEILRQYASRNPEDLSRKVELVQAYAALGQLQQVHKHLEEARSSFTNAVRFGEELVRLFPTNTQFVYDLALAYTLLRDSEATLGHTESAQESQRLAEILSKELVDASPRVPLYQELYKSVRDGRQASSEEALSPTSLPTIFTGIQGNRATARPTSSVGVTDR